ncbi:glycosyltransferase family 4 protein [Halarchaeum sp. P4]|uniref:glycosyltransferase family 4 protein n=1 Tax=Halarchaeum sp. P4 TaxID=3421639 RepID=UPI003EBADCD1
MSADHERNTNAGDAADPLRVRLVGPAGHDRGGIAQYIAAQRTHLGDTVDFDVYDVAVASGSGLRWFLRVVLAAVFDALRFPLATDADVDVAHVHTSHRRSFYRASGYVLYCTLVRGTPVVVHVHGSSFDDFLADAGPLLRRYQALVFDAAARVVVLSEGWADVVGARADPGRIVVLPNAVDAAAYDPDAGATPPRLAFVSGHTERKGIDEFLDAVETLLADDAVPEFRVDIAGDGPRADRTHGVADRHNAVTYHGYVSESRKRALLTDASVYVLPTRAENLPIAVLEAMAGANAVVSTPVGAIPSVVTDANGVRVPAGDADALADALATLIDAPERTRGLGAASRRYVEDTYDWDVVGPRLHDLYREVAALE